MAEGSQTARNPKATRSSTEYVKLARPVAELGQREREPEPRSWAKGDGDVMDVRKVRKNVVTTGRLLSLSRFLCNGNQTHLGENKDPSATA